MVEVPNKKPTTSSSIPLRKSPKKTSTPLPTRELKKRKGVSFEDLPVSSHPSTADYLYSQKKEWSYVNSFFLEDENRNDQKGDDAELLGLCDWFEAEAGSLLNVTEDSEESLPLQIFAEQGMRIQYQAPQTKQITSVSSLRLNSLLRMDSRPRISVASRFEAIKEEGNTKDPSSAKTEKEDMENAFKGVLPCSNSQKPNKRRSAEKPSEPSKSVDVEEEDFWNQVEF